MAKEELEPIKASIGVRIREGVWNEVATFEVEVVLGSTKVLEDSEKIAPEARLGHDVTTKSIIEGMFQAITEMSNDWAGRLADKGETKAERAAERKSVVDWVKWRTAQMLDEIE
jgi:hypothetical protein